MSRVYSPNDFTYGAEHELGDWDTTRGLPPGFGMDRRDYTMVNSNGIAVDPKSKYYKYGGEINTPPTNETTGQLRFMQFIKGLHPEASTNHRSNLHIHIGVPGLKGDLVTLKRLANFNQCWLPQLLDLVEPIPEPIILQYKTMEEYRGARRRFNRRKVSHHTVLPVRRCRLQQEATTVQEFFEAEVPRSKAGKPLWHFQPRAAVNVRQLLETETIEFRHFPGTLNEFELNTCFEWCRAYLRMALNHGGKVNPVNIFNKVFKGQPWPTFPPYIHWVEQRYRATTHDGSLKKLEIIKNIKLIEEGKFDEHPCVMSWEHK